jgi:hypothetical protein
MRATAMVVVAPEASPPASFGAPLELPEELAEPLELLEALAPPELVE